MRSLTLTSSQIVMLTCAPILMIVVSLSERRWGPRVAGILAAAPITAMIGLLLVQSELGEAASHEMATRMSGFVPAQIAVAVVVVALIGRIGYAGGLLLGILSYASVTWLATQLPVQLTIAVSLLFLVSSPRLVPAPIEAVGAVAPSRPAGPWMIALRAVVSLITAFGLLLTAQRFGPAAGGAMGAFPIFTFTLCSFIFTRSGQRGVQLVLAGMVQGLIPYFTFVLAFALTITHLGPMGATTAGALVCGICYVVQARRTLAFATVRAPWPNQGH